MAIRQNLKREAINALLIVMAFWLGYFYREHRMLNNTYTMHDVKVLRKDSPQMYLLASSFGEPFEAKWCDDYIPHLVPGSTLKLLIYEDRGSCKSLSGKKLGYIVARNQNGAPILGGL